MLRDVRTKPLATVHHLVNAVHELPSLLRDSVGAREQRRLSKSKQKKGAKFAARDSLRSRRACRASKPRGAPSGWCPPCLWAWPSRGRSLWNDPSLRASLSVRTSCREGIGSPILSLLQSPSWASASARWQGKARREYAGRFRPRKEKKWDYKRTR